MWTVWRISGLDSAGELVYSIADQIFPIFRKTSIAMVHR